MKMCRLNRGPDAREGLAVDHDIGGGCGGRRDGLRKRHEKDDPERDEVAARHVAERHRGG